MLSVMSSQSHTGDALHVRHPRHPSSFTVATGFIQSTAGHLILSHFTHTRHPGQPFGKSVSCDFIPNSHKSTPQNLGLHNFGFCKHFGQSGQPFESVVGTVPLVQTIFEQSFGVLHNCLGEISSASVSIR